MAPHDHDDALANRRAVVDERTTRLGPHHPSTLEAREALAVRLCDAGELEEAANQAHEVLQQRLAGDPHDREATMRTRAILFMVYLGSDRWGEAVQIQEAQFDDATAAHGSESLRTLGAHQNLTVALNNVGQPERAAEERAQVLWMCAQMLDHTRGRDRQNVLTVQAAARGLGIPGSG